MYLSSTVCDYILSAVDTFLPHECADNVGLAEILSHLQPAAGLRT